MVVLPFQGFGEEDVFVCESRYNIGAKAFKKIKVVVGRENYFTLLQRKVHL